jgi:S1-C subfamily serine protease
LIGLECIVIPRRLVISVWILAVIVTAATVISGAAGVHVGKRSAGPFFTVAAASSASAGATVPFNGSFAPTAKRAVAAVVNISLSRVYRTQELYPFMDDPSFRRFLDLQQAVSETPPSTVVALTIVRENRQDRIQVTLAEQPSQQEKPR